jgi:hypothetical protein
MTFKEFDDFQKALFTEVEVMKSSKGKEYANSEDRFANFNRLADELGLKNYQVGWVYTKKHLDAIAHYCKVGHIESTESIWGRFVDAICYLTLMAGMIEKPKEKSKFAGPDGCPHCSTYGVHTKNCPTLPNPWPGYGTVPHTFEVYNDRFSSKCRWCNEEPDHHNHVRID